MAAVAALPVSLSGRFKGSFAYFIIKDKLPRILTKAIDTLHRHKNEFFEEYGEKGVEAEKRAISLLSKLRNELQTDKPVTPLEDELPDAPLWNQYLDYQRNLSNGNGEPSWFQSPWLYVECYMYRRIHAAIAQNPPIDSFDVFKEGKAQNFFESQEAVIALCTYFQELLKNIKDLDEKQLQEELFKLLQVSLWGNKCDLSFSACEERSQKASPLQSLENMIPYILVNDMEKIWSLLESHNHGLLDIPVTREQINHYRAAAETAQSELAALSVKYDCAKSELLELRSRMVSRETSFQELKAEAESYKENNARQMSRLLSLQTRIQEMEEEACALATSKNQAELAAQAAFKENWELKEDLHGQNAKLNKYLNDCEESMTQASKISSKYEELLTQLSGFLDTDIREKEKPQEHLMSKVSELCKENLTLKEQVAALQETITIHEMESKASRETTMRLVSEVTKEQKKAAGYCQEMEKLSKDLDTAITGRQGLELEIRNLQDKLTANQMALDTSNQELQNLKKSSSELDGSLKSSREEAKTAHSSFVAFKEEIATLLSSGSAIVKPSEKAIFERIQELSCKEENKEIMVSQLENQISRLTQALENQTRLYQEALQRSRKAEKCSETLRDQLKHLEEELLAVDLMQDGLKLEKQKYLKFLEQLNEKMKLDSLAAEVGFDMNLDVILARVEQLVKLESDAVIENKTMVYSLRRKLKTQKEKLESKELHMNLLRQKITQLEEEKQVGTALAAERDEANLTVRKLHKMIERLQKQLDLAKETNTNLKAKLSETNELKIKTLEQNKTIEELSKSQDKLERMKEKAEKQLTSVKSELLLKEHKANEEKEKTKNMLEAVTSEIKVLKTTLEDLAKRERQPCVIFQLLWAHSFLLLREAKKDQTSLTLCTSWQIFERWSHGCWVSTLPAWLFLTMKSLHVLKG
ncbi:coiled-coil domain-containing protein 170-like isoform X2 [Heliangelus exortis]|uniref:coiled-coil domain-containing protein 170-like isoform X2 n=1 Tax=Heliangelus exortis TaxID=472823 RepID=UPI003A94B494